MKAIPDGSGGWRFAAVSALLALAVAAAYLPLRHNGFVNFDDDRLILDNPALRDLSPAGLGEIATLQLFTPHYKPLVYLSWAAELRLFGPDPRAFHRHNLLLHLLNTVLVLALAVRLARPASGPEAAPAGTGRRWRLAGAAAVTAIWALHPMKVESVAWAAERKDVLFAAFYLGGLLAYLGYLDARRRGWLALSAALGLGGMLAKSTAITLLPALLLCDLVRRRRLGWALLVEKLPHLAVTGLALWLYGLLPGPGAAGGSLALLAGGGAVSRLAAAAHRHLAFAAHWLAPVELSVLYPVPGFLARPGWALLGGLVAAHLALLGGLAAALGGRRRLAAGAAIFYTLVLLPVLAAPISTTNYLSDRYTYLPSLGLAALVVLAGAAVGRWRPRLRAVGAIGAFVVAALLGTLTYRQAGVWRDSDRLWNQALRIQPPHPYAHNNRGVARLERGDLDGALDDFELALRLRPDYPEALANRGDLLRRLARPEEGLADLDRAVALAPAWGRLRRARGLALLALGRIDAGIAEYNQALELDPADGEALYLRSQARRRAGDFAGARRDADRALAILPAPSAEAYLLRALIRAHQGELHGALADASLAIELDPRHAVARNNRGFLRLRLDDPAGALADLDTALDLRPRYPLALRNRGDALAALGRRQQACADWRAASNQGAPGTAARLRGCARPADTPPRPEN